MSALVTMATYAKDIHVGSIIQAGRKAGDANRWEVIAMAHGEQVDTLMTMWWRVKNLATGEIKSIPPKSKDSIVRLVVSEEVAESGRAPKPTTLIAPEDSDAIMLLVEQLGATGLAVRDNVTGEITAPNFELFHQFNETIPLREEMLMHLQIAHGMDTSSLGENPDPLAMGAVHARAHSPKRDLGKGGFPHRHVPEDETVMRYSHRKATGK